MMNFENIKRFIDIYYKKIAGFSIGNINITTMTNAFEFEILETVYYSYFNELLEIIMKSGFTKTLGREIIFEKIDDEDDYAYVRRWDLYFDGIRRVKIIDIFAWILRYINGNTPEYICDELTDSLPPDILLRAFQYYIDTYTNFTKPGYIEFDSYARSDETEAKIDICPTDNIDHPNHYQSEDGIEVIDVIKAFTKNLSGEEAFCAGNAIKYILRFDNKNGEEDLNKAIWYINRLKEVKYHADAKKTS